MRVTARLRDVADDQDVRVAHDGLVHLAELRLERHELVQARELSRDHREREHDHAGGDRFPAGSERCDVPVADGGDRHEQEVERVAERDLRVALAAVAALDRVEDARGDEHDGREQQHDRVDLLLHRGDGARARCAKQTHEAQQSQHAGEAQERERVAAAVLVHAVHGRRHDREHVHDAHEAQPELDSVFTTVKTRLLVEPVEVEHKVDGEDDERREIEVVGVHGRVVRLQHVECGDEHGERGLEELPRDAERRELELHAHARAEREVFGDALEELADSVENAGRGLVAIAHEPIFKSRVWCLALRLRIEASFKNGPNTHHLEDSTRAKVIIPILSRLRLCRRRLLLHLSPARYRSPHFLNCDPYSLMASSNSTTTDARVRFPLRGYERMFTMADDGSMKIVHVMVLQGNSAAGIAALLTHLPQAVVSTFNRHPRMRAMQVRDAFAMAEVQPKVALETLSTMKLLEIRHLEHENEEDGESWEKFAEAQSNLPFDRYSELPVYVRAWHYAAQHRVRLMVLSDHFMSDGISGLTVLNDIVSFAARLSSQQQEQDQDDATYIHELPLRPSLYEMWLAPHKWTLRLRRWAVQLFGKMIFKSELRSFTPLIKPRSDQADLAYPVKINSSSALFAQGTPENMQKTLRRCREERVTFFGALAASVVLAYYLGSEQEDKKKATTQLFKLAVDVDFNMRKRVPCPAEEDQVGAYLATSALGSLSKQGVDFAATGFWDLARRCKTELDDTLAGFFMPLTMLFLDENVHSELQPEFLQDLAVPYSISSDVNISNVGKYPYTTTHLFGNNKEEELRIESVHVYNSNPHLGSAAILYVTSTDKFAFSMMHKYETEDAQRVFAGYTACIEHIGEIESGETLAQVASMVAHAVKSNGGSETGGAA